MAPSSVASSSTSGFFQALPKLKPQYTSAERVHHDSCTTTTDDPVLDRLLQQYLPLNAKVQVANDMHDVSRLVLTPSVLRDAVEAETVPPRLSPLTTFGEVNRHDPLVVCQGWKNLKDLGIQIGSVAKAYDTSLAKHNRRIHQFLVDHTWSPASALTMCPMSMSDGCASLLAPRLGDPDGDQPGRAAVLKEYRRRLISSDPKEAWTSGQWMTERSGGSDVRGTETVARRVETSDSAADAGGKDVLGQPLGPWVIDGFKWFSSATDSEMAMLLAQTPKGLSAFCVPMCRQSSSGSELNGIRIQRLKNKMGTKALPTAELELKGARGWLVGEEGRGVKEISTILNITRLHSGAGSVSAWSRALAVSRAYTKVRKVRGAGLYENDQHNFWMASETVKYWAATSFTFFGIALLGCHEQGVGVMAHTRSAKLFPDDQTAISLLRLLTPVIKSQASLASVAGIRACMESLGGVGYCENYEDGGVLNLARLFRDTTVNTIWEGTASIMADDVGRVLRDKRIAGANIVEDVYAPWVRSTLQRGHQKLIKECVAILRRLDEFVALTSELKTDPTQLEYCGRFLLDHLEILTTATLLLHDASTDNDEIATAIASRYVRLMISSSDHGRHPASNWRVESALDRKIFLGVDFASGPVSGKL